MRRKNHSLIFLRSFTVILFFISTVGWNWPWSLFLKNREGVKLYKKGKVDEALSKWRDAQIDDPENSILHYNIASALYKEKKYEEAMSEYDKALASKDAGLQEKAYYNMGNTLYRMGRLPEAIEYYKKALEINPDDRDAKYNIEFVRKKIKENLKKQKGALAREKKEKTSSGRQGRKEEEKKEGGGKAGKTEEAEKGKKKEVEKKGGESGKETEKPEKEAGRGLKEKEAEQGGKKGKEKGKMSKEDALRLLDAVKDDEKEIQRQLMMQGNEGGYTVGKDW